MILPDDPFDRYSDPAVPMLTMVHLSTNLMWQEMQHPREPEAMEFLADNADDIVFAALTHPAAETRADTGKDIASTQATIEDLALAMIARLYDGRWTIALTSGNRPIATGEEFTSAFDAGRWAAGRIGSTVAAPMPVEIGAETQVEPEFTMEDLVVDGYVLTEVVDAPVDGSAITESIPVTEQG